MYVPKHFEETDPSILKGLMREFSFALLVTAREGVPIGTHVPLHINDSGKNVRLWGHLARANTHWQDFDGQREAMAVFQGPHSYISPNWYASEDLPPTWNYATVHAYGRPKIIEDTDEIKEILSQLVRNHENDLTGNWRIGQLTKKNLTAQLKSIVVFEIPIDRLEGKFKMSQNRGPKDAQGAAEGLRAIGNQNAETVATEIETRLRAR